MNLRSVTIWTTGLMLIAPIIIPNVCLSVMDSSRTNSSTPLYDMTVLGLLSVSPMVVSFIVARRLKYDIPALILLVSTITFCFLFVYSQCGYLADSGGNCMQALWLFTPFVSLYWLIPTWIVVLLLNSYYVKKNAGAGTDIPASL